VFLIAFGGYLATPQSSQVYSDPRWTIQLAWSVLSERNLNLDEYQDTINPQDNAVRDYQGHQYYFFPTGSSLFVAPALFLYHLVRPLNAALVARNHPLIQEWLASFIAALTCLLIYGIARMYLTVKQSWLVAFIFAFCTSIWPTVSRALWPNGPSMLCLTLALYLALKARGKPTLVQFTAIPLAFSYIVRPTNAIPIAIFALYVLLYYRKYLLQFLVWSAAILLPFFITNYTIYGTILSPYYQGLDSDTFVFFMPPLQQLLGVLFSPSRGLFIFNPLFLFSCFGLFLTLRHIRRPDPEQALRLALAAIILANLLVVAGFWHWYGGYEIGPRLLADMIPFLVFFLIPVIPTLTATPARVKPLPIAFLACLLVSFLIQFHSAVNPAVWEWNYTPTNIDLDRARLWDWGDPQFLRGFSGWGSLFPPIPGSSPQAIHLYCSAGDQSGKCKTSIDIFDRRWQAFRWQANPPSGVKVIPAQGQNKFERSRLAIQLRDPGETSFAAYPPGIYNLGELKISTIRPGWLKSTASLSILIILHVGAPIP